jgi:hypothetical protein
VQLLFQLRPADGVLIALLGDEAAYGGADQLLLVLGKQMLLRSGLRNRIFLQADPDPAFPKSFVSGSGSRVSE